MAQKMQRLINQQYPELLAQIRAEQAQQQKAEIESQNLAKDVIRPDECGGPPAVKAH